MKTKLQGFGASVSDKSKETYSKSKDKITKFKNEKVVPALEKLKNKIKNKIKNGPTPQKVFSKGQQAWQVTSEKLKSTSTKLDTVMKKRTGDKTGKKNEGDEAKSQSDPTQQTGEAAKPSLLRQTANNVVAKIKTGFSQVTKKVTNIKKNINDALKLKVKPDEKLSNSDQSIKAEKGGKSDSDTSKNRNTALDSQHSRMDYAAAP
uniref:AlNc14C57G4314 protein n=1 Tax=Albugo laibachii Nc14 TaxID=890382 RepID=F0WCD4_9STRA|nr:AlNc14C57G4314 [Albugo laibachii Nc14]|eukprot:CCA18849.1 AlNc14C57G4314 [Albugo laibachii Nc14]